MSGSKIICYCKYVSYADIRQAMVAGARTLDEVADATGAGTGCGRCVSAIEDIIKSVCGCTGAGVEEVVGAVKQGHDTLEAVGAATKAGTCCGRCTPLIENIIENKK
ncbi:MAG: (2Fe-2S)-binding protein [Tannerellaceae bacterium]